MPIKECIGKYKVTDLTTKFDKLVGSGIGEYEAAQQLVVAEIKTLQDDLNKVRRALKTTESKDKPPVVTDTQQIKDKFNAKIAALKDTYEFIPSETQYAALKRLTAGTSDLSDKERTAEFKRRAELHSKSYQESIKGTLSPENEKTERVVKFQQKTEDSMQRFVDDATEFEGKGETFKNGSRIDENGNAMSENDFVTLKEKVLELKKKNISPNKLNSAPKAYLEKLNNRNEKPTKSANNNLSAKQQTKPGSATREDSDSVKGGKEKKRKPVGNRIAKSKRVVKNPLYLQAMNLDAPNLRQQVMLYFIGGGQINTQVLRQLYGNKKKNISNEINSRIGLLNNTTGAKTIDGLAHNLWEDQLNPDQYDSADFRDAVEDVLNSYTGRNAMAQSIVEEMDAVEIENQAAYEEYKNQSENPEEFDDTIEILEGMSDSDIENITPADENGDPDTTISGWKPLDVPLFSIAPADTQAVEQAGTVEEVRDAVFTRNEKEFSALAKRENLKLSDIVADFNNWVAGKVAKFTNLVKDYIRIALTSVALMTTPADKIMIAKAPISISVKADTAEEKANRVKIKDLLKAYYAVNDETVPGDVLNRAMYVWEMFGKPYITLREEMDPDERENRAFADKGRIGDIGNFEDFVAEISHSAQFFKGEELMDRGKQKNQAEYDKVEYERRGSSEYEAHKLIEPVIANFIFKGDTGEELISNSFFTDEAANEARVVLKKYGINFSVGEIKQTDLNKAKVQKIIEFFEKGLNLKVFAPLNSFADKLKELGYGSLQAMVEAYHGSPHSFDKFSMDKIGSGEGAAAFGHGLYFTDMKGIAEGYAKVLSTRNTEWVLEDNVYGNVENITYYDKESFEDFKAIGDTFYNNQIEHFKTLVEKSESEYDKKKWSNYVENATRKKEIFNDIKYEVAKPNLYKVTLHEGKTPEQYDWLLWDKPMGSKIKKLELSFLIGAYYQPTRAYGNYAQLKDISELSKMDGKSFYSLLSQKLGGDKGASDFLLKNGIDGVKYPAESISRGVNSDNARGFNYVVFDDKAVTVKEKIQFLGTPENKVLGFVSGNRIFLNPDALSPLSTFHEIIHIQQALIKSAAQNGDKQAASILKRFDELLDSAITQVENGNKTIRLAGVTTDLSSSVYEKAEGESKADYRERMRNELWSYVQAPVNEKKWDKANANPVKNFIEAVKKWFAEKLGLKDSKDLQSLTLEQLIERSSDSLMKGEYFELNDNNNFVSSPKITQDENGNILLQRLRPEEEQGRNSSGQINAEAAIILSGVHRATGQKFGIYSRELATIKESEEEYLEDFAKTNGTWQEEAEKGIGEFYDSGQENAVYLSKTNTTIVTKLNNLNLHNNWLEFLDRIAIHNALFPSVPYKITGFGKDKDGNFVAIMEQPFVQGLPVSQQETVDYMEAKGFELLKKYDEDLIGAKNEFWEFINKETGVIVGDLHLNNVRKDAAGNIFIIDPVISLDTEDKGYGGTRETALPDLDAADNPPIFNANNGDKNTMFAIAPDKLKKEVEELRKKGMSDEEIKDLYLGNSSVTEQDIDEAMGITGNLNDEFIRNFTLPLSEKKAANDSLKTDLAAGYTNDVLELDDMVDSLELDAAANELNKLVEVAKSKFGEAVTDYAKGLYNHFKDLKDDISKLGVMVQLKNDLDNERRVLDNNIQELKRDDPTNAEISNLTAQREDVVKQLRVVADYIDKQGGEASKKFAILRLTKKLRGVPVAARSKSSIFGKETEQQANDVEQALAEPIDNDVADSAEEETVVFQTKTKGVRKEASSEMVKKAKASIARLKDVKGKLSNLGNEFKRIEEAAKKLC